MKKLVFVAICMAVAITFPTQSQAQKEKKISAEDQKAIVELFKDVDPASYRLQFNKSRDVYGKRKVSMSEIEQVRKLRNPLDEKGWVVLTVKDDGIMFFLAVTGKSLTDVLGAEKAAKLNAITAKYAR